MATSRSSSYKSVIYMAVKREIFVTERSAKGHSVLKGDTHVCHCNCSQDIAKEQSYEPRIHEASSTPRLK